MSTPRPSLATAPPPAEGTPRDPAPTAAVLAAVLVTVFAWASAFLIIRGVRAAFDPGALALGRLVVGTLALGAAVLATRTWVRPTRRECILLAACGVLWFGIYNVALNAAEQHVDAGTAAMLVNVGPIVIALLGGALLGEGFPRWLLVGAGVSFCGAVLIGVATTRGAGRDGLGIVLCLVAALTWSLGVLAQKPALRRLPALQVTWIACTIGAVACLPFAGRLLHDSPAAGGAGAGRPRLPRPGADGARLRDLGVRPVAAARRPARRQYLPGAAAVGARGVAAARR